MEWQPIETAPKDGTWVLIWKRGWTIPAAATWSLAYGGSWTDGEDYAYTQDPTHWMPLPEPPK